MKKSTKKNETYTLGIDAAVNQQSSTTVAVVQEIGWDLDVIVSSRTKPRHPVITPPFIGWASHAGGEVVSSAVDNGTEVISEVLAGECDRDGERWGHGAVTVDFEP